LIIVYHYSDADWFNRFNRNTKKSKRNGYLFDPVKP
jgi:hypothetical protein